jgi:hypothetical protein
MLAGNTAFLPFTPAGAYESIANITVPVGTTLTTISFAGIPSTYTHLQVRAFTANASSVTGIKGRFNGDTGSNYAYHLLYGTGSAAAASAQTTQTALQPGFTSSTTAPSVFIMDVLDYANTNKFKTTRSLDGGDANGSGDVILYSGLWQSTSAITSVSFSMADNSSFPAFSQFALYGIRGN